MTILPSNSTEVPLTLVFRFITLSSVLSTVLSFFSLFTPIWFKPIDISQRRRSHIAHSSMFFSPSAATLCPSHRKEQDRKRTEGGINKAAFSFPPRLLLATLCEANKSRMVTDAGRAWQMARKLTSQAGFLRSSKTKIRYWTLIGWDFFKSI